MNFTQKARYWKNICEIQEKQKQKGLSKYGQILEENTSMQTTERIEYLQEELVDALMYLEHLKEHIVNKVKAGLYQPAVIASKSSERTKEYQVAVTGVAHIVVEANSEEEAIEKARAESIEWDSVDFDFAEEV